VRLRALACAVLAAGLAGCGLGPGKERSGGAELRVTRDFGAHRLASVSVAHVPEDQTVMRLLQSKRRVETRYGGRFVQGIDGLASSGGDGRRDWFYFVNGIEADVGAADLELSPGDVVQWDYRRWDAAMRVPAIVGAYPEPFVHGYRGKRLPTRVECADERARACDEVRRRLTAAGVGASGAALGAPGAGSSVIRVVVAPWRRARTVQAAEPLERKPADSGVFARFVGGNGRLELLDESGRTARAAPAGTGLVAATRLPDQSIVWLVTGADEPAVERAAGELDAAALRDAFAVAATPSGPVRLPVGSGAS
jgi:uncharacterized protein DUF4430